ncbi:hypothetical protein B0H15DRAFT_929972 [Mycena belliarum]|uniref:AAA-ATPase-like domain-containing protein n=1 Tax=Mycena belliarum TaxID=1033014 RepID=A0AAD6UB25_9AGAR|nr:hypothetical protein B0H15DRAFT_929972 [Mycena belliae]
MAASSSTHIGRPVVQDTHSAYCDCLICINRSAFPGFFNKGAPAPIIVDPDFDGPPFEQLTPPTTSSSGSIRSKRTWSRISSGNDEEPRLGESGQTRVKSCPSLSTLHPSPPLDSILTDFRFKARMVIAMEIQHHLHLPRPGDNFHDDPGIVYADKTQHIPELPDKFQILFLRPPRFGKTQFLSTLYQYYDIHEAKNFFQRFRSLPMVSEPSDSIPRHNQHLCLSFNLSYISPHSDIEALKANIAAIMSSAMNIFLYENAAELGQSDPASLSLDDDVEMVVNVFKLVKARGFTLFVGVDDYDFPIRERSFVKRGSLCSDESLLPARDIQRILNTHFWSPLLAESGVIDKLFVTGALLVSYPALKHLDPYSVPSLELSCGFTEQEVTTIAQVVLGETPAGISELHRSCGGYIFPSDGGMAETLFHPQQAITWISKLSLGRLESEDFSFRLLTNILKLLPERSDVQGIVSITTLIDFLAAGAVEVSQTDAALGFDAGAVRWNALYHAGALTYDRQLPDTLRVANSTALSMIHDFVDVTFAERYDLRHKFLDPWYTYSIDDDPEPILDLLSRILRDLSRTSFGRKSEPNLHGILELMLRNRHTFAKKKMDPFLSLDTATRVTIPGHSKVHTWELTTLTLQGMWRAANPNEDAPTVEALRILHEELVQEDEEQLLAMRYTCLSTTDTRLVGDFFDTESEFSQVIAVGGARVLLRQRLSAKPIQFDPCL